jgi:DNA-binding FadR family transcriptional regulator
MKEDLTLVEQTQRDILTYISSNHDKKLPKENELVELLGVSRVVVREALSRLRAVGIIETKKKKGSIVVVPEVFGVLKSIVSSGLLDKQTLRDLYELRLMLEIGMSDFIFASKTDEQMRQLDEIVAEEDNVRRMMIQEEDDNVRFELARQMTDIDVRFHSKLYEMTGNKSLIDFQYILRHLFSLYYPNIRNDYYSQTIVSHISLFNILRTGTADAFRMGMRMHLKTQFDNMETILDKAVNK